eukprot:5352463-Prymnesium_polylepis.1
MQGHNFQLVPVLVGALSEANEAKYGKLFAEVRCPARATEKNGTEGCRCSGATRTTTVSERCALAARALLF